MRTVTTKLSPAQNAYIQSVNQAIDYIVGHIDRGRKPLRLTDVARAARLSPYHFHRIFQMIVGSTPADFAQRLRLDKALLQMANFPRSRPRSMTQVAFASGFTSSSDFSRSFKKRFGVAPSAFDIDEWRNTHRAELESMMPASSDRLHVTSLPAAANPDGFRVKIRDLPARTVAYIRVHNPYQGDAVVKAVQRLVAWADRRGLSDRQWLGYQWENPEITPLKHCRYHAAVEIDDNTVIPRGEIGKFHFPAMTVAEVEIKGTIHLELRALQWAFGVWLPRSGYVPDDHPCFEAWIGRPFAHGFEHFELHAHLPVKRGSPRARN